MIVNDVALRELRAAVGGEVLVPEDGGYQTARRMFNAMIDRRPALIARCTGADDVACVAFAQARGLDVSVKGGDHNVSGKAVSEGGLMIDLSMMKGVHVDPQRRVARAESGLVLGELDRACQAFGLATPTGNVSPTGIAGLTLGGGIGWLNGKHGLACDNVVSVDIVTADAKLRTASATEHPDLFWAVRGGSANVGVVTSDYRVHPVGCGCPDELNINAGFAVAEDGTPLLGIGVGWFGDLDAGERVLKPLRSFEHPVADGIPPMTYVDLQRSDDGTFPIGRRHYWKGGFLRRLGGEAIDVLVHFATTRPSPHTVIGLQQMHGAAARVAPSETAFAHRHDQWDCLMLSQWDRPDDDETNIRWTREFHAAMAPHLERAVYVNDLGADESDRVHAAYGTNYEQLVAIKAKYDPGNFFCGNQNVAAAA